MYNIAMREVATSVRISPHANEILSRLAKKMGKSKSGIVEDALAALEQNAFAQEVRRAYADLRQDEAGWKEYMSEVAVWDKLTADGLPEKEDW